MAAIVPHSFLQQCPSLFAFPNSPTFSTSISLCTSRIYLKFRVYSCCQTSSSSLNAVNGNTKSRACERTEIRCGLPSEGRMASDTLDLLQNSQLSVSQVNPRQYVDQIPQNSGSISLKLNDNEFGIKSNWVIQMGLLAIIQVAEPAMAVTGVNNQEDLIWVLLKAAVVAFGYFLIMPPIIMNWLRIRWYKRNLLEMYVQFMFVFTFFPGILLWAPFLNFRKFPRDPTLKYPWSKPENPSAVKGGFRKFPWATIEDYE